MPNPDQDKFRGGKKCEITDGRGKELQCGTSMFGSPKPPDKQCGTSTLGGGRRNDPHCGTYGDGRNHANQNGDYKK